jgi:hypothetical protein
MEAATSSSTKFLYFSVPYEGNAREVFTDCLRKLEQNTEAPENNMVGVIFDAQLVHESSHSFTKFTTTGGTSFKVVQPTATDEEVIL